MAALMQRRSIGPTIFSWLVVAGLMALMAVSIMTIQREGSSRLSQSKAGDRSIFEPSEPYGVTVENLLSERTEPTRTLIARGSTLFVLGDSHALHYQRNVTPLAEKAGFKLTVRRGCSAIAGLRALDKDCQENSILVNQILETAEPGDAVLLSSLRLMPFSEPWGLHFDSRQDYLDSWFSEEQSLVRETAFLQARELVHRFAEKGLSVIITSPSPITEAPAFRCMDWFNSSHPDCRFGIEIDSKFFAEIQAPIMSSISDLAEIDDVYVLNQADALCPGETCKLLANGKAIIHDGHHLSGEGQRLLLPALLESLIEAGFLQIVELNNAEL